MKDKNNKIKETLKSSYFIAIVLIILSIATLTPVLNMVILGALIAYGLRPISKKLQPKLKYKSVSVIVAIMLTVIPLLAIVIYSLFTGSYIAYSFVKGADISHLTNSTQLASLITPIIPIEFQSYTATITDFLAETISNIGSIAFNYIINMIKSAPMLSIKIFVLIVSIFYFTRDGKKAINFVSSFVPKEKERFFNLMIEEVKIVLKSIFYGHILTGIIIGTIAGIGFFILGYEYSGFLGIITGFFQLIPVIGPWPIYTALFIKDMITGEYLRGIIVLIFGFGLSLSDMYLRPLLSGKYADIHPLIFLLGFLAGPLVFGFVGFILGPLILGITYGVLKAYKKERESLAEIKEGI
ncbi:MAG: AI-2E family transporter [Methanobacteriaceae archaeon]